MLAEAPKPSILFVAPRLPFPIDNGWHQRMFHTLRALSAVGAVDLVCYRDESDIGLDLAPLLSLCRSTHFVQRVVPISPGAPRTRAEALHRYVLASRATYIAQFPGKALAERAESLAGAADLIWTVRLRLAEWMPRHRDRMIVDIDDFESVKQSQQLGPRDIRPWDWLVRLDNRKLRRLERSAPERYGLSVVCSEDQRQFFPPRLRSRVLTVPNGVSGSLLTHSRARAGAPTIVFVGNMDYSPNVDAVGWFVREIFPSVVRRVPDARLLLVGHDSLKLLRPFEDGDRIVTTGSVADVAPFVAASSLSVAPIRVGSGTRIKILESLALGVPVVSTTLGAEGLDLASGREILLADGPQEFAAAVVRLLGERSTRDRMGEAGRAAVAARYTWDRIEQNLAEDVRKWLLQHPRA